MHKQTIFLTLTTLLLLSCHRKDENFCLCMKKSEEVNTLTEKIWQLKGERKDSLQLKKLITSKNKVCDAYTALNSEEVLKLKQDCK